MRRRTGTVGLETPIRMGVIGCGEVAQIMHLPYLMELPEFTVEAVCDLSERVVNHIGDSYGVRRRYTDYTELIADGDVDAIVVATMNHVDVAVAAAEAGLHLLVEKPLAFSPADAERIICAAGENGVKLMVGYMKRYDAAYEFAARRVRAMKGIRLIRVHDFAGSFTAHAPLYTLVRADDLPREQVRLSQREIELAVRRTVGGDRALADIYFSLLMLCSHDAAVMRGMFGAPTAVEFSTVLGDRGLVSVLDYGDYGRCIFEADSGSKFSWWDEQIVVYGREEILSLEFPNPFVKHAATMVRVHETESRLPVLKETPVSFDEAFRREWHQFARCIRLDRRPRTTGEDAKADIELLLEMVRALPITQAQSSSG